MNSFNTFYGFLSRLCVFETPDGVHATDKRVLE